MDSEAFRRHGHEVIEWVADYLRDVEHYRVLPDVRPGEVRDRLPGTPPVQGEAFESILADFREIIMPAVTHWNHPRFFAYFPANNSGPAILGELLSAALGVNAMVWQSCPAATELEEVTLDWLRQMIGLPAEFRGVIQDTASTATLVALICAREQATGFEVNTRGLTGGLGGPGGPGGPGGALRVYASSESHSSVEKGVKAAGLGSANLVKIAVDRNYALDPRDLERRIAADLAEGHRPCCVVATIGTTSSTAIDPLPEIVAIAKRHGLWVHVDAALAGSAAILPECRSLIAGAEGADSLVFNPHKWLFTNFDCSAFFCRRPQHLIRTLSIDPEYLKTAFDTGATNFRDWGLPLGRRFRALKLWFVLRHYGVEGLQAKLREHLAWAQAVKRLIEESEDFELLAPVPLNTLCFRYNPRKRMAAATGARPAAGSPEVTGCGAGGPGSERELDRLNEALLARINATGRIYMTHTRLAGRYCLRLCIGQTQTRWTHVEEAWETIRACAAAPSGTPPQA
jgi:aromatic-L-amino-acid/L-tryptophan decarboxylase